MPHSQTVQTQSLAAVALTASANQPQVHVMPYLIPSKSGLGIVASLTNLGSPDQISVALPAPTFPSNPMVTLTTSNVDATAAATAGFGGLVNVSVSGEASYMICEISTSITRAGRGGSLIVAETWGYSYRMCVKVWGLSGTLSLSAIAANCSVNGTGSAFQVQVIGVPFTKTVGSLTSLTGMATGKFDMSQMEQLGVIQAQLNALVLDPANRGTPELLSVQLNLPAVTNVYSQSPSTLLALSGIAKGYSYNTTVSKSSSLGSKLPSGMHFDTALVQAIYNDTGVGLTSAPNSMQQASAKKNTFRNQKH